MKLLDKMLLIINGCLIIMIIILLLGSILFLGKSYSNIEHYEVLKDINRCLATLELELDNLDSKVNDWSSWDDTYQFIQDHNTKYIEVNLMDETLYHLNINFMIFVDNKYNIVYSKTVDHESRTEIETPAELINHLKPDSPLLSLDNIDDSIQGIIYLSNNPVLIASRPILTSLNKGPSEGVLIFGIFLNEPKIAAISKVIQMPLSIYRLGDINIPEKIKTELLVSSEEKPSALDELSNNMIAGYTLIKDIYGMPSIIMNIEFPRNIYAQGQLTIRYFLIAIAVIGIIFIILTIISINKLILSRIIKLSNDVISIGKSGNLSLRVPVTSKDEISILSQEINNMLTNLEQSTEELAKSQSLYSTLVENSNDGIVIIDKGILKFANIKMSEITGYSAQELFELPFADIISEEHREFVIEDLSRRISNNHMPDKYEATITSKKGEKIFVEVSLNTISIENKTMIIAIIRDITRRKLVQEQMMTSDRLASIGELAAGVAHELNNPLTSVIGYTQLVLEQNIPDHIRKDLEKVESEAKRASDIVKNLLFFARKTTPTKELIDINNLITKVILLRSYEQQINNINVITDFAKDIKLVTGDPSQIQQAFLNIILNAEYSMINFTHGGTLKITTRNNDDHVTITFKDDGGGISRDNLAKIFDPFFTTKDVGRGTGMGLSICYGIISKHNGRIHADSELGKGTTITIELPCIT